MDNLLSMLQLAIGQGATDIFIIAGQPLSGKVNGRIRILGEDRIMPELSRTLVEQAYEMVNMSIKRLETTGDDDLAISVKNLARLRMSAYKQRGSYSAVIRVIPFGIPDYRKMNIPDSVMQTAEITKGLALVTGSAGSGKSTTLACIINRINETRSGHIITLEDPIEYLYKNDKSIVSQREVEIDTKDYVTALRASLRQSPDVILLGEMRDFETIKTALTAAETGHLVLSTLHTLGAVNTIDRIIDIFPPEQQHQVRVQLAMLLRTVVSQQLVNDVNGGIVPVFEIMHVNNAIKNMIRESKAHQIDAVIAASSSEGMVSMDNQLFDLFKRGVISTETALNHSLSYEAMSRRLEALGKRK